MSIVGQQQRLRLMGLLKRRKTTEFQQTVRFRPLHLLFDLFHIHPIKSPLVKFWISTTTGKQLRARGLISSCFLTLFNKSVCVWVTIVAANTYGQPSSRAFWRWSPIPNVKSSIVMDVLSYYTFCFFSVTRQFENYYYNSNNVSKSDFQFMIESQKCSYFMRSSCSPCNTLILEKEIFEFFERVHGSSGAKNLIRLLLKVNVSQSEESVAGRAVDINDRTLLKGQRVERRMSAGEGQETLEALWILVAKEGGI